MSLQRNTSKSSQGFVDDLNSAIRENPLAAGVIGAGLVWMLFGGRRMSAIMGSLPAAAGKVTGAVGSVAQAGGSAVGDGLSAATSHVADTARRVGDGISSGMTHAATAVRDTLAAGYDAASDRVAGSVWQTENAFKDAARSSAHSGVEFGTSLQKHLSETLDRQPLLLGAMGLAIGAGIASAFPSTKVESKFMGEAGAAAKEKFQELASETTEFASTRAKQVLDEVKKEADAQGLTPSAAKDMLKDIAEKVKTVAGSARKSVNGS